LGGAQVHLEGYELFPEEITSATATFRRDSIVPDKNPEEISNMTAYTISDAQAP